MAVGSLPTGRRRRLGRELRRLREERGLRADQVAARLGCSTSRISRIETARIRIAPGTVYEILDALGVSGPARDDLVQLARDAAAPPWWRAYRDAFHESTIDYLALESEARSVQCFEALVVHGLLQVEGYTEALARYWQDDHVALRLESRHKRQERLMADDPLVLHAVFDEAALRRMVGGPGVMRRQWRHLLDSGRRPNVTIQVIPFAAGAHANLIGPFGLLRFADPADSPTVCLESQDMIAYLRRPAEVRRYEQVFDRLTHDALSPEGSLDLIAGLLDSSD